MGIELIHDKDGSCAKVCASDKVGARPVATSKLPIKRAMSFVFKLLISLLHRYWFGTFFGLPVFSSVLMTCTPREGLDIRHRPFHLPRRLLDLHQGDEYRLDAA